MQFRLRTVFMLLSVLVLLMPLIAVYSLKLYENELVKQTESELIAQGAIIAALYRREMQEAPPSYGSIAVYPPVEDGHYLPVLPSLDLADDTILPSITALFPEPEKIDPISLKAGYAIMPLLKDATRTTLAGIRLVNTQGIVVASSREDMHSSLAELEEIRHALTGKPTSRLRARSTKHDAPLVSLSRKEQFRVFVAMPIFRGDRVIGAVLLSRTPQNILETLYPKRWSLAIAGGIILMLVAELVLFITLGITRPLHRLIAQTARVAEGKTFEKLPPVRTKELAELTHAFESMSEKVHQRSDYIRNFAFHLSHEFKTPLTSIRGTAELMQEHLESMSAEEREKFISMIIKDTTRLQQLVGRMLELARADTLQPIQGSTNLSQLLQHLQPEYQDHGLEIVTDIPPVLVLIPEDILGVAVRNLLDNSLKHHATKIIFTLNNKNQNIIITVKDNGGGISEANRQKLFTPFFTTRREKGGTGLGLVITRTLLHHHNGMIVCLPSPNGACFQLTLPSA